MGCFTYDFLVPHEVEEGIEREVVVSSCETGKCSKYSTSYKDPVEMLFETTELLLHLILKYK